MKCINTYNESRKESKMKEILFKYMTRFTSLNEEEQQVISEELLIELNEIRKAELRRNDWIERYSKEG